MNKVFELNVDCFYFSRVSPHLVTNVFWIVSSLPSKVFFLLLIYPELTKCISMLFLQDKKGSKKNLDKSSPDKGDKKKGDLF